MRFRSSPSVPVARAALTFAALLTLALSTTAVVAHAQATPSAGDLAKATQNPVADLTTIPLQFNFFTGGPLEDRTLYNLNIQPVMPLKVTKGMNVIARTIVPYLSIPTTGTERVTGIGDIQEQLFFTPSKAGGLIWGLGPIFSFPTATNDLVKTGDWAAGPTAVVVKMAGPWVLGGLVNQLWTISGDGRGPDINQTAIQPFINYNLEGGWALSTSPLISANWIAPDGEEWTIPLGVGISKVAAIGRRPVSIAIQYYNNVERPPSTAENQLRFVFSLLYPIAKE